MIDLIVDGPSLLAPCWFAITKSEGVTERSVEKVLDSSLITFLTLIDPQGDRIGRFVKNTLCAFDGGSKTDKSSRTEKAAEYYDVMADFQTALSYLFGTICCTHEGVEADDIVATAASQSESEFVYIASGDKDLKQMISRRVRLYDIHHKTLVSEVQACRKWGVHKADQIALALAIEGDRVDNIPGVPGWGPARVKKIFSKIPKNTDLEDAYFIIRKQVPADKVEKFDESLEATLLQADLEGVPKPSPLKLVNDRIDDVTRNPEVIDFYDKVCERYANDSLKVQ